MNRETTPALIAAGLLAAAVAAPVFAHGSDEQKQKVIIMTERHDGERHARVEHDHPRILVADCDGAKTEFSGGADEKGKKTRILICSRGQAKAEDRAKRLEEAIERINKNDELSAEAKAKITTALRDAISHLNAPAH